MLNVYVPNSRASKYKKQMKKLQRQAHNNIQRLLIPLSKKLIEQVDRKALKIKNT